ncbi:hypothetical protein FQ192_18510 [Pseudomonas sp. ANT_J12]|nr:hypothetical protein FQ192_18510 [Pseudomonas sp. ANT_J12]
MARELAPAGLRSSPSLGVASQPSGSKLPRRRFGVMPGWLVPVLPVPRRIRFFETCGPSSISKQPFISSKLCQQHL